MSSSSRSSLGCRPSRSAASAASPGPGAPSSPTRLTAAGSRRRCRASSSPAAAFPGSSPACPRHRLPVSIRLSPSCTPPVILGRWFSWTPATGCSSCVARARVNPLHRPSTSCAIPPPGNGLPCRNRAWSLGTTCFSEEREWKNIAYAALVYDPSVSSHYHVFKLVHEEYEDVHPVKAVEIYSSETGAWVLRESGWKWSTVVRGHPCYFNGFQHFTTLYGKSVAMVDAKGVAWREIQLPSDPSSYDFLGHSQGRLLYVGSVEQDNASAVYALENHDGDEWTFKHRISRYILFGSSELRRWPMDCVAMFHPDCDWILIYDWDQGKLMFYDMNKGDVHVICSLGKQGRPFLPYVPLYSRMLPSLPPDAS